MNMIWIIAWKNIWRNRGRSLVVLVSITLGITGGIFSAAVMKGTGDQRAREAVSRETSHIQIHHPQYIEDNDIQYFIDKEAGIDNRLTRFSRVTNSGVAWSPRVKFMAMAASAGASAGVMVMGVDPRLEAKVTDIHSLIADSCGSWFGEIRGVPVVMGGTLAAKLKVKLHSRIVLTFQDMEGNITGAAFRIAGIYHSNNSVYDEMNVFVRRADITPLLGAPDEICHEIAVRMADEGRTAELEAQLKKEFPELLIRNWKEVDPLLGMVDDLLDLWLYLFMGIILLALGFGIVNTMLMSILERERELGMLAAIGMNKRRIFLMIMLESILLSLTGGLAGMALSLLLIGWTRHTGIDLSALSEGFARMGYNPMLYPSLNVLFFINITMMVILTGIAASIYPARRALKLSPADAIRNE